MNDVLINFSIFECILLSYLHNNERKSNSFHYASLMFVIATALQFLR